MNYDAKLDQLTADLRRRIAKSPSYSPTARAAREQLDRLSSPTCSLSTAAKVKELRETIRTYQWGVNYDHSHHAPNTGPETHPLRPQRP